jgi:hypothetical protein
MHDRNNVPQDRRKHLQNAEVWYFQAAQELEEVEGEECVLSRVDNPRVQTDLDHDVRNGLQLLIAKFAEEPWQHFAEVLQRLLLLELLRFKLLLHRLAQL